MRSSLQKKARRSWAIVWLAVKTFSRINAAQSAAAFAHYAFFSLFPLIVLFVTIASAFIDRDRAGREVIGYVESYVPLGDEMRSYIFDTIAGVVRARSQAGVVAFLVLVWSAMQFFTTLIGATNQAWGAETHNWWRLPLKSLAFLGIMLSAVLLGVAAPVVAKTTKNWLFPAEQFSYWMYVLDSFFIPLLGVFLSLNLFYKLAPRRPTRFGEVWRGALCATALLQAAQTLFVVYVKSFASFNVVYGAFGGIMALLLWIYLSGCIFIFGACLCAAQAQASSESAIPNADRQAARASA